MKRIHVMAGVIRDPNGRILLARRPDHAHQGGLWEFPGGKREQEESRRQALGRELREELGIEVRDARPLIDIRHDYPDKSIRLDVWQVDAFDGEPHGAEGQPVRWVSESELSEYQFPKANEPILKAARLPDTYLITPDLQPGKALLEGIQRALDRGVRLIQLRQTQLSADQYLQQAEWIAQCCAGRALLMLKGDLPPEIPGTGWHLTARQLLALDTAIADGRFPPRPAGLLAASCHNPAELAAAARVGVDFVTLSPLLPTSSHPGAPSLGWARAAEWISETNLPVYLLGGLGADHRAQAWEHGAQGIAGISALW
jgi:8-oxo-dGTP diphosphatase